MLTRPFSISSPGRFASLIQSIVSNGRGEVGCEVIDLDDSFPRERQRSTEDALKHVFCGGVVCENASGQSGQGGRGRFPERAGGCLIPTAGREKEVDKRITHDVLSVRIGGGVLCGVENLVLRLGEALSGARQGRVDAA